MSGHAKKRTAVAPPSVPGATWIPLTRGRFALVDDCDAGWAAFPWYASDERAA